MGKGSIRLKRGDDYYELRAYAGRDPLTNKPRYVSKSFRGSKRDAETALTALVAKVDSEGVTTKRTFLGLLKAYVEHSRSRGLELRTLEGYETQINVLRNDPIASKGLDKIGVHDIDQLYARLSLKPRKPATVRRYHALISASYKRGMAWGWVSKDVAGLASPPPDNSQPRSIPTATVVAQILQETKKSRNPQNYLAFRILAATGARRGEVCGLKWSAIDLENATLEIEESVIRLKSGEIRSKGPKTHQVRTVAIDDQTTEELQKQLRKQTAFAKGAKSKLSKNAYVFSNLTSDPTGRTKIAPDRLTQAFRRIADRIDGGESVTLHDLRHWYASSQIDAGEPLPAVAARIGDNVQTLAKVYAHKVNRDDHAAAESISQLLEE